MTYKEAATYLEMSDKQVRRFVARKELKATRYGHRLVRLAKEDLDAFKQARTS